jgi:hypothetical protein
MGSSEEEKAGDAMGTSERMDFGAQQIGRWEMEKGDRKNLRLTKVYVGTGEGIAGKRKGRFGKEIRITQ